ncbi:MAG TPA: isochorismatase family protein [Acidimicrobiales bacterium]|nr:isochorismatase family protein [Acidimicrobiales bacterium]
MRFGAEVALVVVDVQNDFADPRGSLYVAGGEEVAAAVGADVRAAGAAGAPVVYTQDWHPPDTPHFAKDGGTWPVHCVAGTWGAELVRDLEVAGPVVRKGTGGEDGYSGFTVRDPLSGAAGATGLESLLRDRGVQRLVVAGLATDYCVMETVLDGLRLGFGVTVLTGLVRAVDLEAGAGDRALAAMEDAGARLEP